MNEPSLFSCAGFALLRAPVHPVCRAEEIHVDVAEGAADEAMRLVEYLRAATVDSVLREAVTVSSPSLARRWDEILSGDGRLGIVDLRRAVRALTAYRLRMATRCTPFGLMAGVAVAEIAEGLEEVKVRFGAGHRRASRPEGGWLAALVADWERRPEVLRHLRVMANNLCFTRGGRLVLPYVLDNRSGDQPNNSVTREVSVRYTAAVRVAVERARNPVRYADLERHLGQLFPRVREDAITQMLAQLVAKDILLTELRPPGDTPDPAGHVLAVLADLAPSVLPELSELRAITQGLTDYTAQPLGQGRVAWDLVTSRMRRLHQDDRLVQVDLALDVDVRLPPAVAVEMERAAELLWRLAPQSSPLVQYHQDFLERYGLGRAVAVKEMLDPEAGLGAPAGYRQPPSYRPLQSQFHQDTERDRLLLHLAQDALLDEEPEVVLTDEHPIVSHLARDDGTPPAALELLTYLVADSPAALQAGEFRLVVHGGSDLVGATFGRFAYLLPEQAQLALAELARTPKTGASAPNPLRAQLVFQSRRGRGNNVAQTPRLLDHQIPVGVFAECGAPGTLDLDDLAVCADFHRLFLVRLSDGREVVPAVFHLLNTEDFAPNVARFLSEIRWSGVRCWCPWNWGAAEGLPHTPRVRYGRAVLALACWRPTEAIRDQDAPFRQWVELLQAWRERWQVPERVCLAYLDQRIELALTEPLHQRLLRYELRRRPEAVLFEVADASPPGAGWLLGPDGAHHSELVFPLVKRPSVVLPTAPAQQDTRRLSPPRPMLVEHLPGGEWLYALVHGTPERQNELLVTHLPRLIAALPNEVDRWFFIRYRDQDHQLRLRFHGAPEVLTTTVLPGLHAWAADLRAYGLIQRISLGVYEPELERYGGPEAIEAAERAFHADSRTALDTLALLDTGQLTLEPVVVAAAGYVNMACAFYAPLERKSTTDNATSSEPPWMDWLLQTFPKSEKHKEFQQRRREVLALIDPYGDWAGLRAHPSGAALLSVWAGRSEALVAYYRTLHKLGTQAWATPTQVLQALFHMHHNRVVGIDRDAENASLAIARGVVQAHQDRRRRIH
ncbi:MAG: lantibiotic dehydratase [Pseudonocardiaceae bacterium]